MTVAILATIQPSLPSCNCSCCPAAIPATMWLFLLPCSYSCHHVAILAAMQLFLPPCSYSCCPAAVILATMWLFLLLFLPITSFSCSCLQAILAVVLLDGCSLPQCGYLQLFVLIMWSCLPLYSCSCCRAALFLTPVWLNCPVSAPASYHEYGHFIALGLQHPLSLLF